MGVGRTALSSPAQRSAQQVQEPGGSASTRTVCCPESAGCAAGWGAIVVLPTPPLELATNTVFMRFLRTDETIREGTPARGRPRLHSLDACPRRSFILSRGTDGTGRGLGRGSELRAAARGKRHGMREMIELQQVHRRYAMSGQTVHALAGVELRIDAGEFVAVTGPSGSGTSSLLNILGCLDHPSSGRYLVEGRDVAPPAHQHRPSDG